MPSRPKGASKSRSRAALVTDAAPVDEPMDHSPVDTSGHLVDPPDPILGLVPGVRDRLQARLHAMGIAPARTVSHAARITQRTAQSVRRWFDPHAPGLPDLASFTRLCVGLGCRADALLGIDPPQAQGTQPGRDTLVLADSIEALARTLTARGGIGMPVHVAGDEMAPLLCEGDLAFVDTDHLGLNGNGIYAVEYEGHRLIRRIEQRLGDRIVLRCDNPAYRDCELSADFTQDGRLRIVGKVHAALSLRRL